MDLAQKGSTNSDVWYSQELKTVYNFTYRLSGNREIAEVLTRKVFLESDRRKHEAHLLMMAWREFLQYYSFLDLQGESDIQKTLLALAPAKRSAVILRDMLGYPLEQIAFILKKTETEAVRLIAQGRQEITSKRPEITV